MLNLPFFGEIAELRRKIHAYPELAFEEHQTAALVASSLRSWGVEVIEGMGGTGVVGVIKRGNSPRMIGLRADMDALPIAEKNAFAHVSRQSGVMHACGHDGHTAMLLGAARALVEHGKFDGTVVFIFQPAEEGAGGATRMIEDGLFRRFPVDAVFGLHNWPGLPVGQIAVHSGPAMAGMSALEIRVKGKGCHAAMPHQGVDPIVVSSHLISALQTIVSRNTHPCDSAVVSITQMVSGDTWNVIPNEALLRGTVRSFSDTIHDATEAAIRRVAQGVAIAHNAEIEVRVLDRHPPTVNTAPEAELSAAAATEVVGEAAVLRREYPSMGAEDFSFMLLEKPGSYIWLGNGPTEGGCMLHNPQYDFNDSAIPYGISYWVKLVEKAMPTFQNEERFS